MKLKIVEKLEHATMGNAKPMRKPMRRVDLTQERLPESHPLYDPNRVIIRHKLVLWQQISLPVHFTDTAWKHSMERVRVGFCDTLFGPIHQEIIEALKELWDEGVPADFKGLRRLEAMLPVLRGLQSETDEVPE